MVQATGIANFTTTDFDQLAEELNRDGICIIRQLFDLQLIKEWAKAFNQLFYQRQNQPGRLAPRELSM
jgi:hypothetical protein